MNVNSVNQMAFTGKVATTKNGNEYEKTNSMKLIFPVAGVATAGVSWLFNGRVIKKAIKEIFKEVDIADFSSVTKKYKGIIGAGIGVGMLVGWLAEGSIVDAIINKCRRNDADKVAQTGEHLNKTNNGKIILGSISLVSSAISLLNKANAFIPKKSIAIGSAIGLASSIILGSIIDNKINKTRTDKVA